LCKRCVETRKVRNTPRTMHRD